MKLILFLLNLKDVIFKQNIQDFEHASFELQIVGIPNITNSRVFVKFEDSLLK